MNQYDCGIKKSILFYIKRINDIICIHENSRLKNMGLTISQTVILGYIVIMANEKKIITQKDIEEHFGFSHPTVTGILSRLKDKGFVNITVNKNDRRHRDVEPCEKAFEIQREIIDSTNKIEEIFLKLLPEEKVNSLKETLEILYNGLNEKINE